MGAAVSVPVDIDAAKAAAGDSFDQHKWDAAVKDGQGKVSAELFNAHVLVSEADGNDGKVTANGRRLKKPLLGTRSALPARGRTAAKPFQNLVAFQPPPTKSAGAPVAADDQAKWCINGGDRHDWHRWHKFTPIKKYLLQEVLAEMRRRGYNMRRLPCDWTQAMVKCTHSRGSASAQRVEELLAGLTRIAR